ncbi:antiterminator [Cronobacter sakazakii]|uniref:bacteriophage antitermination protein Q n=1 Tax=Cronobacter sakazakii TaxID=28141 RepID=UPI000A18D88E|nr:bacteriophage antitermination protein Q [Cronobacter sakazakii]ELY2814929.1 antiterminator [Cronobacter sakazakii]PQY53930.1 antiterminator [Cronobacter sakazakii]PUZ03111.1 antiterminator [Cronobacter sakazakii]
MIAQDYEYIRQQLITATADLSGSTKGQLVAFAENAQLAMNRFKRKRLKVRDEETGEMITLHNPPVPGVQSRAKGSSIVLMLPVEYATASWRRAVLALNEVECAWLLWCYSENIRYAHQVEIVCWGWKTFSEELKGQRIAAKTLERLRALVWLAAQDVKRELRKVPQSCYKARELAQIVGVTKSTWSEGYAARWAQMRANFLYLDKRAVIDAAKTRSKQKIANYKQVIANPN